MQSIIDHIPTEMKRQGSTSGGEWGGACPWCGGNDRFRAWPKTDRYWCRQCDVKGDSIDLIRELKGMSYPEACNYLGHDLYRPMKTNRKASKPVKLLTPPNKKWCAKAYAFACECEERLWSHAGEKVLDWLRGRGLNDEVIKGASIGYSAENKEETEELWGLSRGKHVFLDKGVVIPWIIDGDIWRLNIRRKGKPKYRGPAGFTNGLYMAEWIKPGRVVVLTEGEFDALCIIQETGTVAVATGTTSGSRKPKWIARLAQAKKVLVAFDSDKPGEEAAAFWLRILPNAVRLTPTSHDANQMLQDGADLQAWIESGIQELSIA